MTGRLPDAEFWRGRRVLLTGHTGFKGGWLAIWLQRLGSEVVGLSLPAEPGTLGAKLGIETRVASHAVDIRDLAALTRAVQAAEPDIVIHMAAQALVRASYADPLGTFATNVMGTAHLLQALRELPVRAVVVVTTDKCYENREWAWPYRETDALGGYDPYSASKAGAELVTASWRRSFLQAQGVAVASARAGNVIGGGDWSEDRLIPDCVRAFAADAPVHIRNPSATRPWQHVLDPLAGYLLLAETLVADADAARAWNFGPSNDNVATVGEVVGQTVRCWGDGAAWSADAGPHPHEAGLLAVDASLARQKLGWRPRLPLQKAIAWTIAWYKNEMDGQDAHHLMLAEIENYVGEIA